MSAREVHSSVGRRGHVAVQAPASFTGHWSEVNVVSCFTGQWSRGQTCRIQEDQVFVTAASTDVQIHVVCLLCVPQMITSDHLSTSVCLLCVPQMTNFSSPFCVVCCVYLRWPTSFCVVCLLCVLQTANLWSPVYVVCLLCVPQITNFWPLYLVIFGFLLLIPNGNQSGTENMSWSYWKTAPSVIAYDVFQCYLVITAFLYIFFFTRGRAADDTTVLPCSGASVDK